MNLQKKILSSFASLVLATGINAVLVEQAEADGRCPEKGCTSDFVIPKEFKEELNNYRNNWSWLTGYQYSGLHWNQFISIFINQSPKVFKNNYREYVRYYLNDDEEDLGEPRFKSYPPGTIVVKENYLSENGKPGQPLTLTFMIKHKPGFSPETGDWEYVQSDTKGNIIMRGTTDASVHEGCVKCHSNVPGRDYVFSTIYNAGSLE